MADATIRGSLVGQGEQGTTVEEVLELIARARPPWHAIAACRAHPEVNFFPGRGEDCRPALAMRAVCPAREPCLGFALLWNEAGIWGGTTALERRRLRRANQVA